MTKVFIWRSPRGLSPRGLSPVQARSRLFTYTLLSGLSTRSASLCLSFSLSLSLSFLTTAATNRLKIKNTRNWHNFSYTFHYFEILQKLAYTILKMLEQKWYFGCRVLFNFNNNRKSVYFLEFGPEIWNQDFWPESLLFLWWHFKSKSVPSRSAQNHSNPQITNYRRDCGITWQHAEAGPARRPMGCSNLFHDSYKMEEIL